MLLDGAWADIELACDILVAASLHKQIQDLLVARCDFNFIKIDHGGFTFLPAGGSFASRRRQTYSTSFANCSPSLTAGLTPMGVTLGAIHQGFHVAFRKRVVGYEFQIGPAILLMTLTTTKIHEASVNMSAGAGKIIFNRVVFTSTLKTPLPSKRCHGEELVNFFRGGL